MFHSSDFSKQAKAAFGDHWLAGIQNALCDLRCRCSGHLEQARSAVLASLASEPFCSTADGSDHISEAPGADPCHPWQYKAWPSLLVTHEILAKHTFV